MKQKLIDDLLAVQLSIARAVNVGTGILEERDGKDLRAMLIVIPGIVGRVERRKQKKGEAITVYVLPNLQ